MILSKKNQEPLPTGLADVGRALDAESWQWLGDNAPELAEAVQAAVADGTTPLVLRRFVMRRTGRDGLARRCEQAGRWLAGEGEN